MFLPGEREIRDTADALKPFEQGPRGFDIVPLYSRLSAAEQHRVFERHTRRRVVLATNVAETSLTVPGVTGVIDTGLARISRWSARTKVQRLPIEPISQASAQQRSGRCGRVEAGVAIRLYSQEDFEARPAFTEPEILRTSLASVILQMTSLGLGQVERFGFVDPPDRRAVRAGVQLLEELGALVSRSTAVGADPSAAADPRRPATGPAADRPAAGADDPRGGPARLPARGAGDHRRAVDPGPPRATGGAPGARRPAARALPRPALGLRGLAEPLALPARPAAGDGLQRLPPDVPRGAPELPARPRVAGLRVPAAPGRPRRRAQARRADWPSRTRAPTSTASTRRCWPGCSPTSGLRDSSGARGDYLGARGTRFAIFPGSGLFKNPPELVMAAELVETSRLWGRQNAAIDPLWAERLGGDLVKRQYNEPHWSRKRAAAMAHERVTLYGVPLVADRLVPLGQRDPALARELFIRHALVQGEWNHAAPVPADQPASCSSGPRSSSTAPAAAGSWSTRRPSSTSTTRGCRRTSSRVRTSTAGGSRSAARDPDLLTFDPSMLVREGAGPGEGEFPDEWREGSSSLAAELPLRARQRGRRGHRRRPARHPQHRRVRGLHLERARDCATSWSPR